MTNVFVSLLQSIAHVTAPKNYFLRLPVNLVIRNTNSQPIVRMTAKEFMMGYESPLTTLGNTLLPHWIHFDKVGLIDRVRLKIAVFNEFNNIKLSHRCTTSVVTLRHFTPVKQIVACLAFTTHSADRPIFRTGKENIAATFKALRTEQSFKASSRRMKHFCSSEKACVGRKDWWVFILSLSFTSKRKS